MKICISPKWDACQARFSAYVQIRGSKESVPVNGAKKLVKGCRCAQSRWMSSKRQMWENAWMDLDGLRSMSPCIRDDSHQFQAYVHQVIDR